jgi:hypothetical protein
LGFVFAIAIAAGNGTRAVIHALTWAKVSGKFRESFGKVSGEFRATDFGYWAFGYWFLGKG